jgi:predicted RNA-binding protein (virulence factor B family)
MLKIGSYNELIVQRKVDFGLYLNPKEEEVLLPSKYVPENTKIGDRLKVFVYTDSKDRPVATTLAPRAVVGEFAYLEARSTVPFGTFMDWGLEKDLLVPRSEQQVRMKVGRKYVVKVCLDGRTNRVYGTTRIAQNCERPPRDLVRGQKVRILVYSLTKIGIMAVVDNQYTGLLYRSETYEPLAIGDERVGYVNRIRENGKIDLSLKAPGYVSVSGSSRKILNALKKSSGFIPCHDRSTPEKIERLFMMSKKEFKRTIGGLYKRGIIDILDDGIRLKDQ